MRKIVNGCVDCGLPCKGKLCPHMEELEFYCDNCGEVDTLYHYDGEELCLTCIIKRLDLTVVEGTEW